MINDTVHLFKALRAKKNTLLRYIVLLGCTIFLPHTLFAETSEIALNQTTQTGTVYLNDLQNTGLTAQSTQGSTISLPAGTDSMDISFPAYTTPFEFNAIGVKLYGDIPHESVETHVITTTDAGRTLSRHLDILGSDAKEARDGEYVYATYPVIVDSTDTFTLSLTLERSETATPTITDIEVIYINTEASAGMSSLRVMAATTEDSSTDESATTESESALNVISREDWGADESYRYSTDENVIWPEEYVDPEVFIVHHTAGSDGGEDPAATVRAIYYFHAVVYGWGDIGYNYLIDPAGNIYEGRHGGEGVVGGHAYNSVDDIGYNHGSIGISLLGCYETESSGCDTPNDLSDEMKASLQALIVEKAVLHEIIVDDVTTFQGTEMYGLVGHEDVGYTLCPGSITEEYMPTLRENVARLVRRATLRPFYAEFDSALVYTLEGERVRKDEIQPDTDYTMTVAFYNRGWRKWRNDKVAIKLYNSEDYSLPSMLAATTWPKRFGRIYINQTEVRSGERATFTVPLHTPDAEHMNTAHIDTRIRLYVHTQKIKGSPTTLDFEWDDTLAQ